MDQQAPCYSRISLICILFMPLITFAQCADLNYDSLVRLPDFQDSYVSQSYDSLVKRIELAHGDYIKDYAACSNQAKKDSIITSAKHYLTGKLLAEIIPSWERTFWTFEGHTSKPRNGDISCGWFIQRIIEDLSFRFEKRNNQLQYFAQNWPKTMIYGINPEGAVTIHRKADFEGFNDTIMSMQNGIYLAGLAFSFKPLGEHVGILVKSSNEIYLIHSLGSVKKEIATQSHYFETSEFIFLTELFSKTVIDRWLRDELIIWTG